MPADTTDISQLPQSGQGVNTPASGTYGEKAALDRLQQSLPGSPGAGPSAASPVAPMPSPGAGAGLSTPPPPGVPAAILAPTQRPDVPMAGPMPTTPPPPSTLGAQQRRLQVLDALANSPDVAATTREWAQLMLKAAVARSAQ